MLSLHDDNVKLFLSLFQCIFKSKLFSAFCDIRRLIISMGILLKFSGPMLLDCFAKS
jgi:hypothetical protein